MDNFFMWRSLLFIPALADKFIDSAYKRKADCIILDLEDSIALSQKQSARDNLQSGIKKLKEANQSIAIRINNESDLLELDLDVAVVPGVNAIIIPKIELKSLNLVMNIINKYKDIRKLPAIKVIGIVESPLGILELETMAKEHNLDALAFGSEDYMFAMGLSSLSNALYLACHQISLVAHAYNLRCFGFPGSLSNFTDVSLLKSQLTLSKDLGFDGALAIHPNQVELINTTFMPTEAEFAWAQKILDAVNEQDDVGVLNVDGQMVDKPVIKKAEAILQYNLK